MQKDGKTKYLIKNVGILTISNFASKIMVFLLVPLYTSVLTTGEYGVYDLIISMVQLLIPILTLNITSAVMRFTIEGPVKNRNGGMGGMYVFEETGNAQPKGMADFDKNKVVSIGMRHLVTSFVIVGVSLFVILMTGMLSSIRGLEVYVFCYYIFYSLHDFMVQLAKGFECVMDMGVAGIIGTVAQIAGNIILLLVFKLGLEGFFTANILAQALPVAYLSVRLKIWQYIKIRNGGGNGTLHKEMLLYCMPLIFTTLGWWVNNAADKYSVLFILGASATGILSVSYKIPTILNVVQSIFIQAWQISAIKEYGAEDSGHFYGRTFVYLNMMMCVAASVITILSRSLAGFLYAKDFYSAWKYVPFLLIASVMNTASGFLGPILSAAKDSGSMAKSAIYGAVVNIVLNIALVYVIGLQGAAVATAVSSLVIYVVRKKAVGGGIVIEKYWKIYAGWALLCIQAVLEVFSIGYFYEMLILIGLVAMNWREIHGLVGKSFKMVITR